VPVSGFSESAGLGVPAGEVTEKEGSCPVSEGDKCPTSGSGAVGSGAFADSATLWKTGAGLCASGRRPIAPAEPVRQNDSFAFEVSLHDPTRPPVPLW
jgi:hypothetical protein